jgi:hypothetical protein
MMREDKETVERILFSGKEAGLSFEKLDEKMQSWGRKTFGEKYVKDLWRNELLELTTLKPNEDELHKFAFEMHCAEVYDMLCEDAQRKASRRAILLGPVLDRGMANRQQATTT